ncbi:hypothetical protein NDU88_005221 [Pleurodeles waltl]|uniref:Uncharacterized protein n=1 Tax=Pleurodeles waltl TaxID=8319 RepID=A0AAV7W9T8_PLEWA|nr:hypothetical protein NDU88_005221 [Pleurodeles waltl]
MVVTPPATRSTRLRASIYGRKENASRRAPRSFAYLKAEPSCLSWMAASSPQQASPEVVCRPDAALSSCKTPRPGPASPATRGEKQPACCRDQGTCPPPLWKHALLSASAANAPPTRAAQARALQALRRCPTSSDAGGKAAGMLPRSRHPPPPPYLQEHVLPSASATSASRTRAAQARAP